MIRDMMAERDYMFEEEKKHAEKQVQELKEARIEIMVVEVYDFTNRYLGNYKGHGVTITETKAARANYYKLNLDWRNKGKAVNALWKIIRRIKKEIDEEKMTFDTAVTLLKEFYYEKNGPKNTKQFLKQILDHTEWRAE